MPGLLGFAGKTAFSLDHRRVLERMGESLMHRGFYRQIAPVVEAGFAATQIVADGAELAERFCASDGVYLWLDGEIYGEIYGPGRSPQGSDSAAQLLLQAYQAQRLPSVLHDLDGLFCALIYDSRRQQVHLVSDRYGLRRVYWTVHNNTLIWLPELKALLGIPGYSPDLDPEAIDDFLGLRYIQGDRSFLARVTLLPAATQLTWDIVTCRWHMQRYWWWTELSRSTADTSRPADLGAHLAHLFRAAVGRRCQPHSLVGLTLSGGLDSRALLAALPTDRPTTTCLTYGQANCQDGHVAQQVASLANASCHWLKFDADNWFWPRVAALWEMDSPCSLLHAQFASPSQYLRRHNLFAVNLHGEWGDKLSGEQFFAPDRFEAFVDRQLNLSGFARTPAHYDSVMTRAKAYFASLDHSSYLFAIDSRARSFISKDLRICQIEGIETRFPFLDYELQQFLYTIPEPYFRSSALYHRMLLKHFPRYFKRVPYQKTGLPLARSLPKSRLQSRLERCPRPWRRLSRGASALRAQPRDFADYATWLRQGPARGAVAQLLGAAAPLYAQFVDPITVWHDWERHLAGDDLSDRLGTVITLEIWLNQFFEGKYRPSPEGNPGAGLNPYPGA